MAKCSKYHAERKVTMPKCSKYHARWQVLVANCCKYKANGTRKEIPKMPKPDQKRIEKLFFTLYSFEFTNGMCSKQGRERGGRQDERKRWRGGRKAGKCQPPKMITLLPIGRAGMLCGMCLGKGGDMQEGRLEEGRRGRKAWCFQVASFQMGVPVSS